MKAIKTRNLNTLSESAYWSRVRSGLRRTFQFWEPAKAAKNAAKKRVINPDKPRQKWAYNCAHCDGWFMGKEVQIDHVIPCGTLKGPDDLIPFLERLCPEDVSAFQILCKPCHKIKTNEERKKPPIQKS